MRTWLLVGLLATSACDLFSVQNPDYCDQDAQCQTGATCDMQLHHCSSGTTITNPDPTALALTGVTPTTTPNTGGGQVTLSGRNFSPNMMVSINNLEATVVSVNTAGDTATITVPASVTMTCGPVPVQLTNPGGAQAQSGSLLRFGVGVLAFSPSPILLAPATNTTDLIAIETTLGPDDLATINGTAATSLVVRAVSDGSPYAPSTQAGPYTGILKGHVNTKDTLSDLLTITNLGVEHWLNYGNHTFFGESTLTVANVTLAAGIDVNHDGILDLITNANTPTVVAFPGQGMPFGMFNSTAEPVSLGGTPNALAVADFDQDSYGDFAASVPSQGKLQVYFGTAPFGFSQQHMDIDAQGTPSNLLATDVNGDGKTDLLFLTGQSLVLMLNQGGRSFSRYSIDTLIPTPNILQAVDLTCDGLPEVIYAQTNGTGYYVRTNSGVSPFYNGAAMLVPVSGTIMRLTTGNFDNKTPTDIAALFVDSGSTKPAITTWTNISH